MPSSPAARAYSFTGIPFSACASIPDGAAGQVGPSAAACMRSVVSGAGTRTPVPGQPGVAEHPGHRAGHDGGGQPRDPAGHRRGQEDQRHLGHHRPAQRLGEAPAEGQQQPARAADQPRHPASTAPTPGPGPVPGRAARRRRRAAAPASVVAGRAGRPDPHLHRRAPDPAVLGQHVAGAQHGHRHDRHPAVPGQPDRPGVELADPPVGATGCPPGRRRPCGRRPAPGRPRRAGPGRRRARRGGPAGSRPARPAAARRTGTSNQ